MAGGGGNENEVSLNLTPMIDILTCLLFFLLLGYRSQAESVQGINELELPTSISDKGLTLTITVSASMDAIKVEQLEAVTLQEGKLADKHLSGSKIVPVYNLLQKILEQEKMNQIKLDKTAVMLVADKRLKSDLVVNLMKTCGMAGLPNFRFAVSKAD
jgi:biopolymer transport protein ExbD